MEWRRGLLWPQGVLGRAPGRRRGVAHGVINPSIADIRQAWPLLEPVYDHPERLDRTEVLTADRGHDDTQIRSAGTSIRISPSSPSGTGGRIPMRHTSAATSAIVT